MSDHPKIEIWPIERVVPYAKNAKIHDQAQVETLAGLIKQHGWTQPIVVDKDGVIIVGHGRRLAAIHLGRLKVPVICRRDLSAAQANAMRLSDNRVTSTTYDNKLLESELKDLAEELDISGLGFSEKELAFIAESFDEPDLGAFVEDIGEAVEEQKEENAKRAAAIDEAQSPVGEAFGFKKVSVAQSRRIRAFMSECERDTGAKGIDALMAFFDTVGVAA